MMKAVIDTGQVVPERSLRLPRKIIPWDDIHRWAVRVLADELEGCHKNGMPETTGVYANLLMWALN